MKDKQTKQKGSKLPYIFGGLSFIPLLGVIFGILAICTGLSMKKKIPVILGISGILLTVLLYGSLFYFGFVANYGPYYDLKKPLAKHGLTSLRGQILIYKERNNRLPSTLKELGKPSTENIYSIYDPWMKGIEYTVNKDGSFVLRSYGPDGIPNNKDDIVSK